MRLGFLVPAAALLALVGLLAYGLTRDPHTLPSALIGDPVPAFSIPKLNSGGALTATTLRGQVSVVNIWASWCVGCRVEHALVSELAQRSAVPVYGINYKDQPDAARRWLARYGNPYTAIGVDASGSVGIDWGLSGVPETFIIDAEGIVRYKQVGPIDRQALEQKILPLLRRLQHENA